MSELLTEKQKKLFRLLQKYKEQDPSERVSDAIILTVLAAREFGLEDVYIKILEENPDLGFDEMDNMLIAYLPPVEIVDDDEMDDEEDEE